MNNELIPHFSFQYKIDYEPPLSYTWPQSKEQLIRSIIKAYRNKTLKKVFDNLL